MPIIRYIIKVYILVFDEQVRMGTGKTCQYVDDLFVVHILTNSILAIFLLKCVVDNSTL